MPAQMDASLQPSGLTAALVEDDHKTTVWVQWRLRSMYRAHAEVDHVENRIDLQTVTLSVVGRRLLRYRRGLMS